MQSVSILDATTLKSQGIPYTFIDVRESEERENNQISQLPQYHVPLSLIKYFCLSAIEKLPKSELLVCYCSSGKRSLIAALFLHTAGFAKVASLRGGWRTWS